MKLCNFSIPVLKAIIIVSFILAGFGLLESGLVSKKNEVNIMVKNAVDVLFGGLTYWMFGYAFSFGTDPGSNPFCGKYYDTIILMVPFDYTVQ